MFIFNKAKNMNYGNICYLKYYRKEWDKSYDALTTHHKWVKGLIMMWLILLVVNATTLDMAWIDFDFIVSINRPCWTSKSHDEKIATITKEDFPLPPRLSTWLWVTIKSFQHLHVLRKGHLYKYL
jgi:hypothetical protein